MWFCFDGESFEVFATEGEAKESAILAMESWQDDAAANNGWDELASQVCFGKVTHAVQWARMLCATWSNCKHGVLGESMQP